MSLTTQNLSFAIKGTPLVQDVSIQITPGKLTAIMGLNGSGKTTLMRLLSGFNSPTAGNITLGGKDLASLSRLEIAQNITVVPQDFPTTFPFTVFEFVAMGLYPWKTTLFESANEQERVTQVLRRLDLTEFTERTLSQLSGGERQRVLLARALVQDTPILFLDEPLNHLDVKNRAFLLKLLREEKQNHGKTIVAIMHNLKEVYDHFEEVILLKGGQVCQTGPCADVFQAPILSNAFDTAPEDLWLP